MGIPRLTLRSASVACAVAAIATAVVFGVAAGVRAISVQQRGGSSSSGHSLRQPTAVTNGLVAWYPLDGNAQDYSGNGNDGTLSGFTYDGTTNGWTAGKFGRGLMFNGTSDYVSVGSALNPSSLLNGSYTVSAWVTSTASTGDTWRPIFGDASGSTFYLGSASGNNRQLVATMSGVQSGIPGSYVLNDGGWHHVAAVVIPGVSVTVYFDGKSYFSGNTPGTQTTVSISIGSDQRGEHWKGSIDDVRIYNRALSAGEIAQLYQGSQPASCDQTCVGYWKLDGSGSGTVAADSSSNGNAGTLMGFSFDGTTNGWTSGVFGNGLMFNGTNRYITVGNVLPFSSGSSITLSYWGTIATDNAFRKAIAKNSGGSNRNYEFGFNNANGVTFLYVNNGGYNIWNSSNAYTDTAWHFYAVTYTFGAGGSIKVYRDGVPISGTWTVGTGNGSPPTDTETLCIGSSQEYWDGSLDDVRIYNRALTSYEVYDQYAAGR